jgi:prevent-host-death family protein
LDPMPEVVPISDMRTRQKDLLEVAAENPILLTHHGRAVAVLLGPERFNRLLERVEELELALDAAEVREAAEPTIEFEHYLAERGENVPDPPDG